MKDLISKICKKGKKACGSVVQNALATKRAALSIFALTICILSMAQSKGAAGFQKAATEISSYQDPVQKLLYAIAGVIALVGSIYLCSCSIACILQIKYWVERLKSKYYMLGEVLST